jgi:hypothetical protein
MKKLFFINLFYIIASTAFGQTFEGKIIYAVSYQYNTTNKKDTSISIGLGTIETFYIKNGDYLIKGNGSKKEWVLYKSSTNKIYTKYKGNDTLFVNDASINHNKIKDKYHYRKAATVTEKNSVTGKKETIRRDDEYVFITENGDEYFYYNRKYKINSKLFVNHRHGHLSEFVGLSNCIPLVMNFNVGKYNCEKFAGDIVPERLDNSFFAIPNDLVLKEMQIYFDTE